MTFLAGLVVHFQPQQWHLTVKPDVKHYSLDIQPKSLGELAIISVCLGVLIGFIETNDLSGLFFRLIRATQRTTRSSVWSDVFHERKGVVQVELGDGRSVMGWIWGDRLACTVAYPRTIT
jgi:hypothetical protein